MALFVKHYHGIFGSDNGGIVDYGGIPSLSDQMMDVNGEINDIHFDLSNFLITKGLNLINVFLKKTLNRQYFK